MSVVTSIFSERPRIWRQCFMLTRVCVVARGVMFAGIIWESAGPQTQVTECLIVWFAMFSPYDVLVDLMEASL